jgi:TPR repeat protein
MYRDGAGVTQSADQAVAWFRKSAEQGYTKAMLNLGAIYERMTKASAPAAAPQQAPAPAQQPMPAMPRPGSPMAMPLTMPMPPVMMPLPMGR